MLTEDSQIFSKLSMLASMIDILTGVDKLQKPESNDIIVGPKMQKLMELNQKKEPVNVEGEI